MINRLGCISCLLACLLAGSASAAIVTVPATGTLVGINDPDGLLPFTNLVIGATQFSLTFSYDDSTSGSLGDTTEVYIGAIQSMTLSVDGGINGQVDISAPVAGKNFVFIDNDSPNEETGTFFDTWFGRSENTSLESLVFVLSTESSTTPVAPLTSTALVPPVFPDTWGVGIIAYNLHEVQEVEPGVFESVVIASATALIFAVPDAAADGPIQVIDGIANVIPVGVNDIGFTDPVTVTVTTPPSKGTIGAISPPGPAAGMSITYTANIGTVGADSFVYQMTDGTPASNTATVTVNISPDTDADGVSGATDNCTLVANASQCDSDGDGYGNHCDGDLNNNGFTNAQDYILFRQQLGQPSVAPTYNQADINCNTAVNAQDYILFRSRLGQPSGPSGLVP